MGSRSTGPILLLLSLAAFAGCGFELPFAPAGANPNLPLGGSSDAGGAGTDALAGGADARSSDDAAPLDAASNDSGGSDDGSPDAGAGDAAGADSGRPSDAGSFDGATRADAGSPIPCPPSLAASPGLLGTIRVPHPIDRPVLLADLDGDGIDEIVLASRMSSQTSVVHFAGCGAASVLTFFTRLGADGPIAIPGSGARPPLLATLHDDGHLAFYRLTGGSAPAVSVFSEVELGGEPDFLAASPGGELLIATGRDPHGDPAFTTIAPMGLPSPWARVDRRVTGRPAFLSNPSGQGPRFVVSDGDGASILRPGSATIDLATPNFKPESDPATVLPGFALDSFATVGFGGTHSNDLFGTVRVDTQDLNSQSSLGAFGLHDPVLGGPVVLLHQGAFNSEDLRYYFLEENGRVEGCQVDLDLGGDPNCHSNNLVAPINVFDLGMNEASAAAGPITGYINDNPNPDLIFSAVSSGTIVFRTSDLSMEAAPAVALGIRIAGTPGLSPSFFPSIGTPGNLLAVPHTDGRVSLIGWAQQMMEGPAYRLWPQFRHDAARERKPGTMISARPILIALAMATLLGCPDQSMSRASDLERSGQLDDAARAYKAIARNDPANLAAWDKAVELWCQRVGHVGECMNVLELELDRLGSVMRHKDALSEVLETRARARLDQGMVDAALDDLARAERASPLRASLYVARARALTMRGERAAAVEALSKARELDPRNAEANALVEALPTAEPPGEDNFGGTP